MVNKLSSSYSCIFSGIFLFVGGRLGNVMLARQTEVHAAAGAMSSRGHSIAYMMKMIFICHYTSVANDKVKIFILLLFPIILYAPEPD